MASAGTACVAVSAEQCAFLDLLPCFDVDAIQMAVQQFFTDARIVDPYVFRAVAFCAAAEYDALFYTIDLPFLIVCAVIRAAVEFEAASGSVIAEVAGNIPVCALKYFADYFHRESSPLSRLEFVK